MPWLWIVGPIGVVVVYLLTWWKPSRRRADELAKWRASFISAASSQESASTYRSPGKKSARKDEPPPPRGPKEVASLPKEMALAIDETGAGSSRAYFELLPKLGYFVVVDADSGCSSDFQVVVAKLGKAAPTFVARPLPIVEGARIVNTGVRFAKDAAFMDLFLVEGTDAPAITKWLKKPIRSALLEHPNVWLAVRGRTMTVTLYGSADADDMDDLILCADSIFAEVGAEGGPSLVGESDEDDEEDDEEGEDEDEEGDEGDEDDAAAEEAKPANLARS